MNVGIVTFGHLADAFIQMRTTEARRRDIREEAVVLCLLCVLRVRVLLAGAEEEI